jgi:hypothetical protein
MSPGRDTPSTLVIAMFTTATWSTPELATKLPRAAAERPSSRPRRKPEEASGISRGRPCGGWPPSPCWPVDSHQGDDILALLF